MLTYFLDQKWFVRSFVNPLDNKLIYDVWAGSSVVNSSCYPIILNCGKQTADKISEDHNLIFERLVMLLPICAECLGRIPSEEMGKYSCDEHNIQFCGSCQDSQIVTFKNGKMNVVNKTGERPLMQHAIDVHGWLD